MIYLSSWLICYGPPSEMKNFPHGNKVKPTWFQGDGVLVGMPSGMAIGHDPKHPTLDATGIFWMAGSYDGTGADFLKMEMSRMYEPMTVIFDGIATFEDGKVTFKGRHLKPFSDIRHGIFMLVDEQLEDGDERVDEAYPVVVVS